MVEPTPLKNMLVKLGSSSPIFGVNIKIELPPPRLRMFTQHSSLFELRLALLSQVESPEVLPPTNERKLFNNKDVTHFLR